MAEIKIESTLEQRGEKIRSLRMAQNDSMRSLLEDSNCYTNESNLCNIEHGNKECSICVIVALAHELNTSVDSLIYEPCTPEASGTNQKKKNSIFLPRFTGRMIQKLRKERGINVKEFAEMVGCCTEHISRIENGHKIPPLQKYMKMADALGVPLSAIVYQEADTQEEADRDLPEKKRKKK